jgi:hypothetical protein
MDWQEDSACKGVLADADSNYSDNAFFPMNFTEKTYQIAMNDFCSNCPVFAECAEFQAIHKYSGVWAGRLFDVEGNEQPKRRYSENTRKSGRNYSKRDRKKIQDTIAERLAG